MLGALLVAWLTSYCSFWRLAGSEELFYIYDSGLWPNISSASLSARNKQEIISYYSNRGAGEVIDEAAGQYNTDQYQLFSLIYHRALVDPRRTLDPSKASTFIIPYDLTTDIAYYRINPKDGFTKQLDMRKCPLGPQVNSLLKASPWFHRRQGLDHILIVGMNYAMDYYLLKPKCKATLQFCTNCTKFSIDDYSFLYPTNEGILQRGDYWNAVPFPSNFHWTTKVVRPFVYENTDRPILVSYIGSSRSYWNVARSLRQSISYYCKIHSECVHQAYASKGNGTVHTARDPHLSKGENPHAALSMRSVFCFQPPGDLMTRKGLFDSLLHGCIPVLFSPLSASVMYTWHWTEDLWKSATIEFPLDPTLKREFDPVAAVKAMYASNPAEIAEKQRLIRENVFALQYSLESYVEGSSWPLSAAGEPAKDAYELIIEQALSWHSGRVKRLRNATVPECWGGGIVVNNKCTLP